MTTPGGGGHESTWTMLAPLGIPIVAETSGLFRQVREDGTRAGQEFAQHLNEGIMQGLERSELPRMFDPVINAISGKQALLIGTVAAAVEAGLNLVVHGIERIVETVEHGIEEVIHEAVHIGETFEDINRQLITYSTASGQALTDLRELTRDVYGRLDTDAKNLGQTIGVLRQQFPDLATDTKVANAALGELSHDILEVGDRMGAINTREFIAAMHQFNLTGMDGSKMLAILTGDAQAFGIRIQDLITDMTTAGPTFAELGSNFEATAQGMSKIEQLGLNAQRVIVGVANAAKEAGKEANGSDFKQFIQDTIDAIKWYEEHGERAKAFELGVGVFNTRNAAQAIAAGQDILDMMNNVVDAGDRIRTPEGLHQWEDATRNLHNAWTEFMHDMQAAVGPIAEELVERFTHVLDGIKRWFDEHHQEIMDRIRGWGDAFIQALPAIKQFAEDGIRVFGLFLNFLKSGLADTVNLVGELLEGIGKLFHHPEMFDLGKKMISDAEDINKIDFGKLGDNLANAIERGIKIDPNALEQQWDDAWLKATGGDPHDGISVPVIPKVQPPEFPDWLTPFGVPPGQMPSGPQIPGAPAYPGGPVGPFPGTTGTGPYWQTGPGGPVQPPQQLWPGPYWQSGPGVQQPGPGQQPPWIAGPHTAPSGYGTSGTNWDAIAQGESGGNWSIPSDTQGRPYRGGLQILDSTWREYGGTQFAPTANLATREQQITIAERILVGQGPNAWPNTYRLGAPTGQPMGYGGGIPSSGLPTGFLSDYGARAGNPTIPPPDENTIRQWVQANFGIPNTFGTGSWENRAHSYDQGWHHRGFGGATVPSGYAFDFSGSPQQMSALANWVARNWSQDTLELIYQGAGFSPQNLIKDTRFGDVYGPGTLSEHTSHVHWAMTAAPYQVSGMGGGLGNVMLTGYQTGGGIPGWPMTPAPAPGGPGVTDVQPAPGGGYYITAPGFPNQIFVRPGEQPSQAMERERALEQAQGRATKADQVDIGELERQKETARIDAEKWNELYRTRAPTDPTWQEGGENYKRWDAANRKLTEATDKLASALESQTRTHQDLTIQQQKQYEDATKASRRTGTMGGDPAEQLGRGLLGGILEEIGIPDVLGKSPLEWGSVKMGMGALNWGFGVMNAFGLNPLAPNYRGAQPGIAAGIPATGPQEVSPFGPSRGAPPGPISATIGPRLSPMPGQQIQPGLVMQAGGEVPAILHAGEYVVPEWMASVLAPGLEAIRVHGFQEGGDVNGSGSWTDWLKTIWNATQPRLMHSFDQPGEVVPESMRSTRTGEVPPALPMLLALLPELGRGEQEYIKSHGYSVDLNSGQIYGGGGRFQQGGVVSAIPLSPGRPVSASPNISMGQWFANQSVNNLMSGIGGVANAALADLDPRSTYGILHQPVTNDYSITISGNTIADPAALQRALQESQNQRFYSVTGGLPYPSVGSP